MTETPSSIIDAREQFLALVAVIRPELHRYCARLTGSVIEGEDIVQDTLAKAFYALSLSPEVPPLRPWLFRIAHNAALDFLKSHATRFTQVSDQLEDVPDLDATQEPAAIRTALAHFLTLPVAQRSAVILKDVLDHSLEETAETMGISVMAVKALLVRGRRRLAAKRDEVEPAMTARAELERYASLFNARDWEGVRALVSEDCRLDLVSKSQRRGKQVRMYFDRYERDQVQLRVVRLDGELLLAAYVGGADHPTYFIVVTFDAHQVSAIRDFRYVPYIAHEAAFELVDGAEFAALAPR